MGLFLFILSGALNITIRHTKKHCQKRLIFSFDNVFLIHSVITLFLTFYRTYYNTTHFSLKIISLQVFSRLL